MGIEFSIERAPTTILRSTLLSLLSAASLTAGQNFSCELTSTIFIQSVNIVDRNTVDSGYNEILGTVEFYSL